MFYHKSWKILILRETANEVSSQVKFWQLQGGDFHLKKCSGNFLLLVLSHIYTATLHLQESFAYKNLSNYRDICKSWTQNSSQKKNVTFWSFLTHLQESLVFKNQDIGKSWTEIQKKWHQKYDWCHVGIFGRSSWQQAGH